MFEFPSEGMGWKYRLNKAAPMEAGEPTSSGDEDVQL